MRLLLILSSLILGLSDSSRAEVTKIATGYQYGLTYLPLMVMQEQKLVEAKAKAAGINLTTEWRVLSGPAAINDGLLAGSLQFGAVGTSSLVTLWAKTRKNLGIRAVGALSSMPIYLNTNNPRVNSIRDFTAKDRIALPSVKVGVQAVVLQMAAAQTFGDKEFAKLDPMTVGLGHPEALVAILSGRSEITAHFTSAPFAQIELDKGQGKIRTVLKSNDVLGGPLTFTAVVASTKFYSANPTVYGIYASAFSEASQWINTNKDAAAALYVKVTGSKDPLPFITKLLSDPDNAYDLTPRKFAAFADFMFKVGTIKEKAESWKDLSHPNLHNLAGS
ncbi:MAG: ABC transporter substrate-binding protein [Deltaproteobacteria bacterium]|nr:ABC transporter substrate-binding protein [Deltaproteobacteria bacterium]